jgi:hypothetical protein
MILILITIFVYENVENWNWCSEVSVIFFKAVDSVKKRKGDTARDFLF